MRSTTYVEPLRKRTSDGAVNDSSASITAYSSSRLLLV
jgi:hypothetical protein